MKQGFLIQAGKPSHGKDRRLYRQNFTPPLLSSPLCVLPISAFSESQRCKNPTPLFRLTLSPIANSLSPSDGLMVRWSDSLPLRLPTFSSSFPSFGHPSGTPDKPPSTTVNSPSALTASVPLKEAPACPVEAPAAAQACYPDRAADGENRRPWGLPHGREIS